MINITLKDGSVRQVGEGLSILEIARGISEGLARNALCGLVDGERADLREVIASDCSLSIATFDDPDGKWTLRHTASHVLAQAVKRLYPDALLAIGPAIDSGFYYDIDFKTPITSEDLPKIEEEIKKIIKEGHAPARFTLGHADAIKWADEHSEFYKRALIEDLPEDAALSFYTQGEFTDLCAGPHLMSLKTIKAVKLLSLAGAYWRGDEKNKMLTRIYGTAFEKQSELDAYVAALEEAKKRDHRKLGKELGLFALLDEGPGMPFFMPKGMLVKNELLNFWRSIHREEGYDEISTPVILDRALWERSGHWEHYSENMYTTEIDERQFAVKPMNCPGSILMYMQGQRSYRDLPVRYAELGLVHRHEKSGALHGLMRVRCFTQDDAHIFLAKEQIKDEVQAITSLINRFYGYFGFKYAVELSTRPEDSMGSDEDWEIATSSLKNALDDLGLPYVVNEGDGAFYGPKIDFHLEDTIGRTWQCGTIQLDMQLPERFSLEYVDKDGSRKRPVMIHRVVFGSVERFIGILIEHFAGAFPLWLAPVQVKLLPISDKYADYAATVSSKLKAAGIRVETDGRAEKIGYKIREARNERVPYIAVVGEKEAENGSVSLRSREAEEGEVSLGGLIERLSREIAEKSLPPAAADKQQS